MEVLTMLQLVRLNGCVHIYDQEKRCFIKTTSKNVAKALDLGLRNAGEGSVITCDKMIKSTKWEKCDDKGCQYCHPQPKEGMCIRWLKPKTTSHFIAIRKRHIN